MRRNIPFILDDFNSVVKVRDSSIASIVSVSASKLSIEPEHEGELSGLEFIICNVSN